METKIVNESFIEKELKKYNITDALIVKLSEECMDLKVEHPEDKESYAIVRKARIDIKGKRVEIEKKRKELKVNSIKFGKAVDTEAKRITALLEPIETYLITQEKIVDDEKERIKAEEERIKREKIETEENIRRKEEEERQAVIIAEQKTENERLEIIRKEQEDIRLEQEEKERIIKDKEDAIRAEKLAIERTEELKQAKEEAANQARIEEANKTKREAENKRIVEDQERKEKELKAALMPDNEKLLLFAESIKALPRPTLSHEQSHKVLKESLVYLKQAFNILKGGR